VPLIYRAGNMVEAQLVVDELKAGWNCGTGKPIP